MTNADAIKAALYTALWAFIGTFGVSIIGFLGDIAEWADSSAQFPSIEPLGKAAVSAAVAAASGLVAAVVRLVQVKLGKGGPVYPTSDS